MMLSPSCATSASTPPSLALVSATRLRRRQLLMAPIADRFDLRKHALLVVYAGLIVGTWLRAGA